MPDETTTRRSTATNSTRTAPTDCTDPVLVATIRAATLEAVLDAANVIVDECILEVTPTGLAITAIDPATVGMIDLELDADAFDAYDAERTRLGIDLERLGDVVGMATTDQLVELGVDDATRTLHVRFGELAYTLACIDPDAVRDPPETVAIADELDATISIAGDVITRTINAAAMLADTLEIGIDRDGSAPTLYAHADGDTDTVDVTLTETDCHEFDPAPAESLYSIAYLETLTTSLPGDRPVTIHLGEEAPITFDYEIADGNGEITYLVAPRLTTA